jgi:hypothetical protein
MRKTINRWLCVSRISVAIHTTKFLSVQYDPFFVLTSCLKRWKALAQYLDNDRALINNNWVDNQMRPQVLCRKTGCSLVLYEVVSVR